MLNLYDAAKISRNPLARGICLGVATTNELMPELPWKELPGESFVYNRENVLASAEFVSPTHTSLTESGTSFDRVTVPMRLIETDVDVYNYTRNMLDPNGDPAAIQLEKKLKAVGRLIQQKAIQGNYNTGFAVDRSGSSPGAAVSAVVAGPGLDSDRYGPGDLRYTNTGTKWAFRAPGDRAFGADVVISANGSATLYSDNPSKWIKVTIVVASATADGICQITFSSTNNEPDGLATMIPASQTVSSAGNNGDALSFDVLDNLLYSKIKVRDNPRYLMNGALKRKFMALARTSFVRPEEIAMPVLGMDGKMSERRVPSYNGIPILQVDDIPTNESKGTSNGTLSSVYLVNLGGDQGFYGGVQSVGVGLNPDLDPYQARIMGFQLYDVGQLEQKGAHRRRVEWFGAFALGSQLAAARASEIVAV